VSEARHARNLERVWLRRREKAGDGASGDRDRDPARPVEHRDRQLVRDRGPVVRVVELDGLEDTVPPARGAHRAGMPGSIRPRGGLRWRDGPEATHDRGVAALRHLEDLEAGGDEPDDLGKGPPVDGREAPRGDLELELRAAWSPYEEAVTVAGEDIAPVDAVPIIQEEVLAASRTRLELVVELVLLTCREIGLLPRIEIGGGRVGDLFELRGVPATQEAGAARSSVAEGLPRLALLLR
jgi:hypothetical protein